MMLTCARCADRVPRLTVTDRYCKPCARAVETVIALDARRRTPRFPFAKELAS